MAEPIYEAEVQDVNGPHVYRDTLPSVAAQLAEDFHAWPYNITLAVVTPASAAELGVLRARVAELCARNTQEAARLAEHRTVVHTCAAYTQVLMDPGLEPALRELLVTARARKTAELVALERSKHE